MKLANGAVTGEKIAEGAVTGEKIAGGQVVRVLNGLTDEIDLVEGTNVTITPSDNKLVISASGGGGRRLRLRHRGAGGVLGRRVEHLG
jgi:hypothetical protein